jgi:hypothetical protein
MQTSSTGAFGTSGTAYTNPEHAQGALDVPMNSSQSSSRSAPNIAQDADIIEKEWIDAVKRVFSAHREDPYSLNEAMANLRRYYLHKRYGRELEK